MMNIKAKRDIAHKTKILNHARESKNIAKTCRHFGSSRETFYTWKRAYERDGEKGLMALLQISGEIEHKHACGVSIAAEPLYSYATPFSSFILCSMYIPRPAKLLFQYDDAWNHFIDNNPVDEWQLLSVEKMLACSTCAMGIRRYHCSSPECSHSRFFCQTCKSKACSACGLKGTEQWIAQQRHILPDCE